MDLFTKMRDGDKGQLICFPYLGGYVNSFYDLIKSFNENFEIWVANPPGHFGSNLELVSDINVLTDMYYKEIEQIISEESCVLGHSMGGTVAFALINKIANNDKLPLPRKLILSATSTPDVYDKQQCSSLSDSDLINCIKNYGGMPESLLANHDLMNIMLPIFRADYKILESAAKTKLEQIDIDTLILWGEDDKVDSIGNAFLWGKLLRKGLNVVPLKNASHMFIHDRAKEVVIHVENFINL